ncbi:MULTISPECIES: dihydrolipoyllysine-residue acetyltransferase [unclassified Arsukibacterium]|uniref:dihydrolipoyllysine-residue acetyltransferase n=1 Tax=unclassified Arsukibacterium TaxID=2635278 RepID=UPI000C3A73CC|nr:MULTISPECIES: dihydrolipoyllysine-residue acetyltransferase [unclassified Arsukibacterium]MAA93610.1 dihydrolipoyllysine-residue acetyltransferase [Rheinheimera sp.]MBM33135.1 dihydrolipoyllysine-residue acetyltransferase [Rheinheimera sp.]|tara:strand:- start:22064 stop:23794 length:1731 start_codon:yes stop_codon:yes gene_type:complete
MTNEIKVPDIGADEVEVTEILVKVGDKIKPEQSLLSVEGDKAAMDIPSPAGGVVKEIKVKTGDKIETGSLIMIFEGDAEEDSKDSDDKDPQNAKQADDKKSDDKTSDKQKSADSKPAEKKSGGSASKDVEVPDIGGDPVEVTEILVKVGDSVKADQSLLSVEGDKASMEVPAPFEGKVKEIKVSVGDKVETGSLIMVFETAADDADSVEQSADSASEDSSKDDKKDDKKGDSKSDNNASGQSSAKADSADKADKGDGFVENKAYAHASPVIRRLAREFGINLAKVNGTGRKGRVVKEDVQNYVKQLVKQAESGSVAGAGGVGGEHSKLGFDLIAWPKVDFAKFGEVESKPLSRIQKLSGNNLHRNWVRIPHVTQFDEADITGLEDFRKEQNALAEKKKMGVKYTPLVFIMKAVAKALEDYPTFCSSLSEDGQSLIMKKYIHLGIAVDTPNGLVVPVVKDVNKKGIIELSRELMEISSKAREGKLSSADMQGGCFTISSLGGIGGTAFTPIVNAPEVAILGVSKSEIKPKWNGKEFEPKLMVPLSVSYDHRVIDGALAARFTATLASYLADIRQIIM